LVRLPILLSAAIAPSHSDSEISKPKISGSQTWTITITDEEVLPSITHCDINAALIVILISHDVPCDDQVRNRVPSVTSPGVSAVKELQSHRFEGEPISTVDIEIEGQTLRSVELHFSLHLTGVHARDADQVRLFKSAFNANRSVTLNGVPYRIRSSYPAEFGQPDTFYLVPDVSGPGASGT
jgi:hypothetical protein